MRRRGQDEAGGMAGDGCRSNSEPGRVLPRELQAPQDDAVGRALLALSIGAPIAATVARLWNRYQTEPTWRIVGYEASGRLLGALGLELIAPAAATIRHLAVVPEERGRGIGRQLLAAVARRYALRTPTAETDRDAVGFYRRCGFTITSLGEQYPGVERFRCRRRGSATAAE